ncbi:sigma-54-dependent Fis family transcriptional regulator [Xinfangfangia sp. D13-10-4-6]|uniref:sigma-54-dependent Fis family transcriptional regulator n=1 Tax=Pseudogemmobacter hezensis TaxID=2737662 RepID=UPI0015542EDF|nr:sigma-54-dependent Fis family transcriptional regulator [Pseudogemmobacter hezensis]NPD14411.1 sigma-54-dependent Fis family transcriptional regulator [Pseudogemmobacter hezensis]
MQADIDHIREIEGVSHQGSETRDPVVVESWLRCLQKHGLDPANRAEAYILPEAALRQHRQRSEDLIRIARSGIDDLYKLVAGQNYVLLLSDDAGVTVEYLGEDSQKAELRRSGLYMGAEWSEARAGTCALGACIETGEPLIIHQSDHFDVTHGGLSCTAAPIYDTGGRLAAVLDISLLSSPRARASQFLALNLVRQTARRIEMANIMAEARADWVLRLAGSPDFLDVDPQAAIRLDQAGRVIGMTNGAARLMARSLGQDWRQGAGLIGRHISDMFNLDLAGLEGLTRQHAARDRLLETRDGYRLFAHAIEPRPRPAPLPPRPQVIPAALREVAGDDPQMREIAARAAIMAPGRLPLLIEGAVGCGKSTLARAIHDAARRGPFVTLACDTLAEDEAALLFGRGDARAYVPGLIDQAEGGTLVLENPGALPPRLQARLLPLVSEHSFRPVGGLRERPSAARLILTCDTAAPNGLREDLLHRIAAGRLRLPGLAQRRDLIALASRIFSHAFATPVTFEREAARALTRHPWPGNLQELTALAGALALAWDRGTARMVTLGLTHLPAQFHQPEGISDGPAMLAHLLDRHGWNVSAVARELGVDRSTIHRQIRRHGLMRGD